MSPSTCLQGGARQPLENTISNKSGSVHVVQATIQRQGLNQKKTDRCTQILEIS